MPGYYSCCSLYTVCLEGWEYWHRGLQDRCKEVNKENKYVLIVRGFVCSLSLQDRLWCPLGSLRIVTGAFCTEQEMVNTCILIMVDTCYSLWHKSAVTVLHCWTVSTGANVNIKPMQAVYLKRSRLYSWGTHFESCPEYRLLWWPSRLSTVLLGELQSISFKATMASFRLNCNLLYILKYWQGKFTLELAMEAHRESKYIALLISLTSALVGVVGQRHALAGLPPGKTRCPLYRRLGGPQGRRYWRNRSVNRKTLKILPMKESLLSSDANRMLWFAEPSRINDISGACLDSVRLLCLIMHVRSMFSSIMTRQLGLDSKALCFPTLTWSINCERCSSSYFYC
jgi:hypothetical protein